MCTHHQISDSRVKYFSLYAICLDLMCSQKRTSSFKNYQTFGMFQSAEARTSHVFSIFFESPTCPRVLQGNERGNVCGVLETSSSKVLKDFKFVYGLLKKNKGILGHSKNSWTNLADSIRSCKVFTDSDELFDILRSLQGSKKVWLFFNRFWTFGSECA